jgi:DNA-binding transcriptional LysR family regulator
MGTIDLSNFNLNLLVALDALLRECSVTGAARRARVTPSAMSHSLAELRALVGDPLLVRTGRGMTLSPRAEGLRLPLQRVLVDTSRLLESGTRFDPATARRHFVLAAPDFLTVLLASRIADTLRARAPGVTLELVPTERRGNAWRLETGEIDLALGAVVAEAPGIRRMDLCTEGFACAARRGHPDIDGALSLDQYVATPHLVITLGDDARPTWIDEALAARGRSRHVALRVRSFLAAPLVVAATDLLMTGPSMLIRHFAALVPLQVLEPPIALPTYPEEAFWHERFDGDAAHAWLRDTVREATRTLGIGRAPERRTWDLAPSHERRSRRVEDKPAPRRRRRK